MLVVVWTWRSFQLIGTIECDNKDVTVWRVALNPLSADCSNVTEGQGQKSRQAGVLHMAVGRLLEDDDRIKCAVYRSVCLSMSAIITVEAPKAIWLTPRPPRPLAAFHEHPAGTLGRTRLSARATSDPVDVGSLICTGPVHGVCANNEDETVRIWADYHPQMYTLRPRRLDSDILRQAINDQSSVL